MKMQILTSFLGRGSGRKGRLATRIFGLGMRVGMMLSEIVQVMIDLQLH